MYITSDKYVGSIFKRDFETNARHNNIISLFHVVLSITAYVHVWTIWTEMIATFT